MVCRREAEHDTWPYDSQPLSTQSLAAELHRTETRRPTEASQAERLVGELGRTRRMEWALWDPLGGAPKNTLD